MRVEPVDGFFGENMIVFEGLHRGGFVSRGFEVIAPDGSKLKRGQIATAYASSHVNFTLANGGTMTSGRLPTVGVVASYWMSSMSSLRKTTLPNESDVAVATATSRLGFHLERGRSWRRWATASRRSCRRGPPAMRGLPTGASPR